jgi:hypothetical protein
MGCFTGECVEWVSTRQRGDAGSRAKEYFVEEEVYREEVSVSIHNVTCCRTERARDEFGGAALDRCELFGHCN